MNAPIGTEVFAVNDGKIIHNPYEFAGETFALEVDHGDFVVRYGEIQKELPPGLGVGKTVKRGQLIAYVGKFVTEEVAGSDVYTLSFEIIHLQGVPAETSGRGALVKAMNKAAEDSGDNLWKYRKASSGSYECTLGSEKDWENIGNSKQMWSKTALACTDEQRTTVRIHMEKAEKIALTIEP